MQISFTIFIFNFVSNESGVSFGRPQLLLINNCQWRENLFGVKIAILVESNERQGNVLCIGVVLIVMYLLVSC